MKKILPFCFFFIIFSTIHAQNKSFQAIRIEQAPKIDGVLNEEYWSGPVSATDFIQKEPQPGVPSRQKAEVRVVYDDNALYIGAKLFDVSKDSILHQLSPRDNEESTDIFGFVLDTYNDDQNAFGFFVTASGVQVDAKYSQNGQDFNWNAVWESAVKIENDGWYVEMKIPYSAIRFSKVSEQTWGINFLRKIKRYNEMSFWNDVKPTVPGFISQSGDLTGISNIKSPLRLSFTPYVSAYVENYPYNIAGRSNNTYSINGGLDLKLGISEGFTLDMTLVPDFGQVQSDNQVLNLSPFEVRYDENRPFFTEGTELFNKGNLFYSRRVGAAPAGFYDVLYSYDEKDIISNPSVTQLLNATKITGRTKSNLGIGVFNATAAEMSARVRDVDGNEKKIVTEPLTNYNVVVLDQALKNNSNINFINTNVTRNGAYYDANVTGGGFRLANKKNTYAFGAGGALSQKYFTDTTELGHAYHASFGKISGNFNWDLGASVENDTYDPNDLGILFNNNTIETSLHLNYNIFEPFWKVNQLYTHVGFNYARIYKPSAFAEFSIFGNAFTTFSKNALSTGFFFDADPVTIYDYFEPRVPGRFYLFPKNIVFGSFISSDYRKTLALDVEWSYRHFDEAGRKSFSFSISPRILVNDKLNFVFNFNRNIQLGNIGYVYDYNDTIIFGRRNVQTIFTTVDANYTFNNKMSLTLRGRHYWSKVRYNDFFLLETNGTLSPEEFSAADRNFNAFNIDLVYSWHFAPGSEMSIVWKNAILKDEDRVENLYFENIKRTIASPPTNNVSIKVLYYLDYAMLKRKR
jgi:hypothetical protein